MTARARARVLAVALAASALGDAGGGLWAVFDWQGVAQFMAGAVPDWRDVGRAAEHGLEDLALKQLWANLGAALVALGIAQAVAAWWVLREQESGFVLARVVGWTLVVAAILMAGPGGQVSSLVTEGARGVLLIGLAIWASPRAGGGGG